MKPTQHWSNCPGGSVNESTLSPSMSSLALAPNCLCSRSRSGTKHASLCAVITSWHRLETSPLVLPMSITVARIEAIVRPLALRHLPSMFASAFIPSKVCCFLDRWCRHELSAMESSDLEILAGTWHLDREVPLDPSIGLVLQRRSPGPPPHLPRSLGPRRLGWIEAVGVPRGPEARVPRGIGWRCRIEGIATEAGRWTKTSDAIRDPRWIRGSERTRERYPKKQVKPSRSQTIQRGWRVERQCSTSKWQVMERRPSKLAKWHAARRNIGSGTTQARGKAEIASTRQTQMHRGTMKNQQRLEDESTQ